MKARIVCDDLGQAVGVALKAETQEDTNLFTLLSNDVYYMDREEGVVLQLARIEDGDPACEDMGIDVDEWLLGLAVE